MKKITLSANALRNIGELSDLLAWAADSKDVNGQLVLEIPDGAEMPEHIRAILAAALGVPEPQQPQQTQQPDAKGAEIEAKMEAGRAWLREALKAPTPVWERMRAELVRAAEETAPAIIRTIGDLPADKGAYIVSRAVKAGELAALEEAADLAREVRQGDL